MEEKRNGQVGAGEQFWRSLDELEQSPDFEALLQQEFPRQAAPLGNFVSRRQFLRLMGASMALAGLSACGYKPQGPIISRPKTPEDRLTGISHYYATAVLTNGYGFGVLGRVYEGRPVKLEGNPDHPTSLGATDAIVQAQILDLYDPDRSQEEVFNMYYKTPRTEEEMKAMLDRYNIPYDPNNIPRNQLELGKLLVKHYNIHKEQLSDCSICHR